MKRDYAIGAFAISNMEQIESIVEAAIICRSPLIIMISKKSLKYSKYIAYLIDAAIKENSEIPIAMHLDHSQNFDQCREAIDKKVILWIIMRVRNAGFLVLKFDL
ncbi:class II fructose-bisphosphate aldolase [Patescibacteria group bacterium]|nr:class II fructose-bisphosphate aldolase [Patescibacteria group bacterium]